MRFTQCSIISRCTWFALLVKMADDLVQVARMLSRAAERLTTNIENSPSSSEASPAATVTPTDSSRMDRELGTLFPHHFQPSSSRNYASNFPRKSRKRKASEASSKAKKGKAIVRKFICLSDKDQSETPDAEEQRELLMAGLGETKIFVPEESNEPEIRDLIMETFPRLQGAGGFELMYAEPRKRDLNVIPPGPNGLTMKYLATFVGQGKIYVRPIQEDLALESSPLVQMNVQVKKERCKRCLALLDVYALREHYATCSKQENSSKSTHLAL